MKIVDIASGSPASQLHPAVASRLSFPSPGGETTLNAPPPVVSQAPQPPDTRGVQPPPGAQPVTMPPATILKPGDMPPGTTETAAPTPPPAAQGPPHLNYDDDPVLQNIKQRVGMANSGSAADFLGNAQQLLLAYGSKGLAQDYISNLMNDVSFRSALGDELWNKFYGKVPALYDQIDANANPDTGLSTLAQLAYQNRADQRNQDEGYNQNNLFFSGAHGAAIQQLARDFAFKQNTAAQDVLGKLATGRTGLLNTIYGGLNQLSDAEQAAYDRRLEEALKYGTGGPGSDAGGGSGGGDTGGASGGGKAPKPTGPGAAPNIPDNRARKGANPPPAYVAPKRLINPYTTGRKKRG